MSFYEERWKVLNRLAEELKPVCCTLVRIDHPTAGGSMLQVALTCTVVGEVFINEDYLDPSRPEDDESKARHSIRKQFINEHPSNPYDAQQRQREE